MVTAAQKATSHRCNAAQKSSTSKGRGPACQGNVHKALSSEFVQDSDDDSG